MNKIGKIALISFCLLILTIGISCASAASVNHSTADSLHVKNQQTSVKIDQNSKNLKETAKKTDSSKKISAQKTSSKKTTINKKTSAKQTTTKKTVATKKTTAKKTSVKPVDKIINGWNPKDHEVSRKSLGNGHYRVNYDDGYFRIIDANGNILSYGY